MRRRLLVLAAFALIFSGCGGSAGPARKELRTTADRLGQIRSGDLTLLLLVSPASGTKGRIGFKLQGPFALRRGALPVADLRYTQYAGPRQATATFVSTGTKAYAVSGGKT